MTVLVLCALAVIDPWSAEVIEREPPTELAAGLRSALESKATEIKDGTTTTMTVWFRSVLPLEAPAEVLANGAGYREMPAGSLVAAIRLHHPFIDFRKQRIAAGVYTLRFMVQPEVGDHVGTSPHPEFVLLCPASDDVSSAVVEQPELLKWSRQTTGGDHPAVMLLMPASGASERPKVAERAGGLRVLQLRRPAAAGTVKTTLNLGLVISGSSPTR